MQIQIKHIYKFTNAVSSSRKCYVVLICNKKAASACTASTYA